MPPVPVTNSETVENLLKLASGTPSGCFVEIGVYQGGTSYLLAQIADKQDRELHLFDIGFDSEIVRNSVKELCPNAILHPGEFPKSWGGVSNIAFCFYDLGDSSGAKFLIEKMPEDFVKGGIALFYYIHSNVIDYNKHPNWTIGGRGNQRYPYIVNR